MLEQIQEVEGRLMNAQINSDIDELTALLADDLLAVGLDGQLVGKEDDLAAHRARIFRIESMTRHDLIIKSLTPEIAVAFVLMDIQGYIRDQPAFGRYRYTRVWTNLHGNWQITAAHISSG